MVSRAALTVVSLAASAAGSELVPHAEAGERVQVFVTWHRGWTNFGDGYCKKNEVDCYGEVEGSRTSVASNDKTPEWYETTMFERSCSDYRDITFRMVDSDQGKRGDGDDDLIVECRFTLADFVKMRFTKPKQGLPAHLDAEVWHKGESIKSKGCLAKQCVHTCLGSPPHHGAGGSDEANGFQFALAGVRFSGENGCGDQPFMPGHDGYDLDKFHALRNQSYKDGGAIAWPAPATLEPVEPTALELASVFDLTAPAPRARFAVGDVVPVAWDHAGAVSDESVEIYAVPVTDAAPLGDGVAPSPRDLQREYKDAAKISVVAWGAPVGRGELPGGWLVPLNLATGDYRLRAYPANMYPAWSAAFHVTGLDDASEGDDPRLATLDKVRVFCVAALLAVVAATITVAGAKRMRKRALPVANVLDAQVAYVVPAGGAEGAPPAARATELAPTKERTSVFATVDPASVDPVSAAVEVAAPPAEKGDDVIHIDVSETPKAPPAAGEEATEFL